MPVPETLLRFRRSVWFRVLYVAILAFLVSVLLLAPGISLLLVPATLAILPYYLRERGYRRYIVNGLVAIAGGILLVAAISSANITNQTSAPILGGSTGGVDLTNGTVAPYRGAPGEQFLFSVDLRTASPVGPGDVQVWLNLSYFELTGRSVTVDPAPGLTAHNASDLNFKDGKRYEVSVVAAQEAIYFFAFSALVNLSSSPVFARTSSDAGPAVVGFGQYFVASAIFVAIYYAIGPTLFYFIGLGGYWLYRRSRRQRAAIAQSRKEPPGPTEVAGDTFTCTNCGATVSEADEKCPSCGAVFEPEPEMPAKERGPPKTGGPYTEP